MIKKKKIPVFEKVHCFYYFQKGRKMKTASVGEGVVKGTALYVPGGNGIYITSLWSILLLYKNFTTCTIFDLLLPFLENCPREN